MFSKILNFMNAKHNHILFKSIVIGLAAAMVSIFCPDAARACTSAIVSAKASADGKPFIWKHRDTGTEHNFIERVQNPGHLTYVALFNGGDSLLRDAWLGMNEAGLMIMNTASYNLAPDTARLVDREGDVMRRALESCVTVGDFLNLLDTLPRPMGVQANFGVLDREGNGGYFETNDIGYTPFLLSDTVTYIVRTNFSVSGNDTDGYGYIRYDNACELLGQPPFKPSMLTEGLSRSFFHSLLERDYENDPAQRWVVDQDFIPRYSSTASVVMINGLGAEEDLMMAALGYPPVAELFKITVDDVPDAVRPVAEGFRAPACNESIERKRLAFPIRRGSGSHYIDMDYVRKINGEMRNRNLRLYNSLEK